MTNDETRQLCMGLVKADSEAEVVQILKQAGYWDDPDCWRYFDDNENSFSTMNNHSMLLLKYWSMAGRSVSFRKLPTPTNVAFCH